MLPLLIVGGILLALAALLLAPVRLELSFREAFSAQVRYLFLDVYKRQHLHRPAGVGRPHGQGLCPAALGAVLPGLCQAEIPVSYTHLGQDAARQPGKNPWVSAF